MTESLPTTRRGVLLSPLDGSDHGLNAGFVVSPGADMVRTFPFHIFTGAAVLWVNVNPRGPLNTSPWSAVIVKSNLMEQVSQYPSGRSDPPKALMSCDSTARYMLPSPSEIFLVLHSPT